MIRRITEAPPASETSAGWRVRSRARVRSIEKKERERESSRERERESQRWHENGRERERELCTEKGYELDQDGVALRLDMPPAREPG